MSGVGRIGAGGLLAVQLLLAGYGASPLMEAHCICTHAVDADCDCPHHAAARAGVPPCHRKHRATPKPKGTTLQAHCGSSGMKLVLFAPAPAPERAAERAVDVPPLPLLEIATEIPWRAISPPRRPPRA